MLGAALRIQLADDNQALRRVGGVCVLVAVIAWGLAFFTVVPLASNAAAVAALGARAGLHYSRKRSATRVINP